MQKITIFTDGSCLGNPGPGGWGAIIRIGEGKTATEQELCGGIAHTTNNRMELTAVIEAFKYLHAHKLDTVPATVYLDSSLVVHTLKNGWKKRANLELWQELEKLLNGRKVRWEWVKGHAGHPENERCDRLAQGEAQKYLKKANIKHQTSTKKSEDEALLCPSCNTTIQPLLSLLPDAGHIRADCPTCGRYLKFIHPSPQAYEKARKRVLLTKDELHALMQAKQAKGEKVGPKELQKLKNCTRPEATAYLQIQDTLF